MRLWFGGAMIFCLSANVYCAGQAVHDGARVTVRYEDPVRNENYPELLYWFVTPETLVPAQYSEDVRHIAHDTYFDFPFLTARNGVNFFSTPATHDAVKAIVDEGHHQGLRVGATLQLMDINSMRTFPFNEEQTVVADGESTLDGAGHGVVESSIKLRSTAAQKTELLRVFVFRKTGPGEYDPSTLHDVTADVTSQTTEPGTMAVTVNLGPRYAGYTAFSMTTTWFRALDMFNDAYLRWVHEAIDQYSDVRFDGTALDEFGYVRVPIKPTTPYRGQFAGAAFSAQFERTKRMSLTKTLFETRYAPEGHPEVRIRAIDEYWDFQRTAPLRIEREFYNYSRQVFGDKNFAGIHDTFHNHLTNAEAWATGITWWTIPRQFGMSDEDLSLPLRMGLLVSHPGKIMYDQFYGFDIPRFAEKSLRDVRFDARLHYHGYNDTGRWGADLSKQPFLRSQNPVEEKIRLLNAFHPAAPRLPLLVVFGMPALLNWYPDEAARNEFDINGGLHIEEKVQSIWDAGYRCAVVPSDLIDTGAIRLDARNRPVLNGHTFQAVIYLYPQYAKPSTLRFLEQYTRHGGALMLEGTATRDFDGAPVADQLMKIASHVRAHEFSLDGIPALGVQKSALRDTGGELEDGSIILTDLASLQTKQPKEFSVDVNGHHFTGDYVGVFALKARPDGSIEKLACGGCSALQRDGSTVLTLRSGADIVLRSTGNAAYEAIVRGEKDSNVIDLRR